MWAKNNKTKKIEKTRGCQKMLLDLRSRNVCCQCSRNLNGQSKLASFRSCQPQVVTET